jgi:hypothetical protein
VTAAERRLRCPVCADEFVWPDEPVVWIFDEDQGRYVQFDISAKPPEKRAELARFGYQRCPNPTGDASEHFLPATYGDHGDPLVIGLVGGPTSGKTHLLTAMIRQAHLNGLSAYGLTVAAMDFRRHSWFRRQYIRPLEEGTTLWGTGAGVVEAADILLLSGPAGKRPLVFFDVAGEDLEKTSPLANRFMMAATGVIFVHAAEDPLETGQRSSASENQTFELATARLAHGRVPAAIAVTKADRLRHTAPADRWMYRGDEHELDARRIRAESQDVYAYLHQAGAGASLRPFDEFPRCTLHFVSASGGDAVRVNPADVRSRKHFARGFQPRRVLEPLVSILAMSGMITGAEAGKVGLP